MDLQSEFSTLRQRLDELGRRFDRRAGAGSPETSAQGNRPRSRLDQFIFSVRRFFTEGITGDSLRDLVQRDPRDTFRFFARGVDLDELRPLPWFKRYPLAIWRVFLAIAYKLTPPRRIVFAAAVAFFLIGWASYAAAAVVTYLMLSLLLFFALLMMELRDKLTLKADLEIAREIQFSLVPSAPFDRDGISINSRMKPANTVGGDYYDILGLPDNVIGIVIGDVAGKGMPAALLMAMLQGSLRTLISAGFRGGELVRKLNDYLYDNIPANSLVTLFYSELNPATGELRYVNAGHNAPCLMHEMRCERLASTATVLGSFPGLEFEVSAASLDHGDRLLLFTDGLTEASNPTDEEYGEARAEAFVQAHRELAPGQLIEELMADVLTFCGAARPADDITVMTVSRT